MRTCPAIIQSLKNISCWKRTNNAYAKFMKIHVHRNYRRRINRDLKTHIDWDEWIDAPNKTEQLTKWDLY